LKNPYSWPNDQPDPAIAFLVFQRVTDFGKGLSELRLLEAWSKVEIVWQDINNSGVHLAGLGSDANSTC
jgi:hypothetical protein